MTTQKSSFLVSIPAGKEYVLTVFYEPMTHEMTVAYLKEVKRLGETLPRPRFLFDARGAPNARATLDDYEIYDFAKVFGFPGARIAVVVDPDDRSYDFTNDVACNAGYEHRLFTSEQDALVWLEDR